MDTISLNDTGPAVEDVQQKLQHLGFLEENQVDGCFGEATAAAVAAFCQSRGLAPSLSVTDKVWAALLDASFQLGDRTLFLRMPYFHGNDVAQLQQALGALGFPCDEDAIFGAHTELALRKFQMNMGLPSDGIAGAFTYRAIKNLHHSWAGKPSPHTAVHVGFARAADVLERHALCLFGTDPFTRSVAARMSNLALATNPVSKIVSAENLLVAPDEGMMLVHIVSNEFDAEPTVPFVMYNDESTLDLRLRSALGAVVSKPGRLAVCLPGTRWGEAGEDRSAQHYAITLLDAFCSALTSDLEN